MDVWVFGECLWYLIPKLNWNKKIIAPKGCPGLNRESLRGILFSAPGNQAAFLIQRGFRILYWETLLKSPKASQTETPKTKNRPPVSVWRNTGNNLYPTCYNGVLKVEQRKGVKKVHSSVSWVCPPTIWDEKKFSSTLSLCGSSSFQSLRKGGLLLSAQNQRAHTHGPGKCGL